MNLPGGSLPAVNPRRASFRAVRFGVFSTDGITFLLYHAAHRVVNAKGMLCKPKRLLGIFFY